MSCPKCKWDPYKDCKEYKLGGPVLRKITNVHQNYADFGESWTEYYKCPRCKTEFTEFNGT